MTQLHAGGKFDQNSYKVSGGLHGVGVSVVNALSVWLKLRIWRDGKEHFIEFANGDAVRPLDRHRRRRRSKTASPSAARKSPSCRRTATFTMVEFDYATIEHRLRELAFLNSGVHIVLTDARHAEIKQRGSLLRRRAGGLRALSRPRQDAAAVRADHGATASATRSPSKSRCGGTTAITRTCWSSPTIFRSATAARISPAFAPR